MGPSHESENGIAKKDRWVKVQQGLRLPKEPGPLSGKNHRAGPKGAQSQLGLQTGFDKFGS